MKKLVLYMLDDDAHYLEQAARFASKSTGCSMFIVRSFTHADHVAAKLREKEKVDLLLGKRTLLDELSITADLTVVELIGDDEVAGFEGLLHGEAAVHKYQPLDKLFGKLLSIWEEQTGMAFANSDGENSRATVTAVFSAVGGSGKTTVAANCAKLLAFRGRRTFFLNLETLQSVPIFAGGLGAQSFAKFLYYVKADDTHLSSRLKQLAEYDPDCRVSHFGPLSSINELEEMTGEDSFRVAEYIRDCGEYEEVLIDLDGMLNGRSLGAIRACDRLIWLFTDDIQSLAKTRLLHDKLRDILATEWNAAMPRITFVMNKYTGTAINRASDFGIGEYVKLPYMPAWKSVNDFGQLLCEADFQEHLLSGILSDSTFGAVGCHG